MTLTLNQPLDLAIAEGVATVTLNRPDVRNAFDEAVIAQLTAMLAQLGADPGVRAVVLAGAGPIFCAGGDLSWMRRMADYDEAANLADARSLGKLLSTLDTLPKPTLARVQGGAYAGGIGLIAACDIVVAGSDARFAVTEVRIGLAPAVISPYLVRAMGARICRRLFLTAEVFQAEQALSWGLLHEVVAPDQLDDRIAAHLSALSKGAAAAQAVSKKLIADVDRPLDDAVIEKTVRAIAAQRASPEGREGVSAFLDKRKPSWLMTGTSP
jgi:methylglutaconyl-CoA hydratase